VERSYGLFERSFALPETVDADQVSATLENGVPTVTLPRAEKAKASSIEVKGKQDDAVIRRLGDWLSCQSPNRLIA